MSFAWSMLHSNCSIAAMIAHYMSVWPVQPLICTSVSTSRGKCIDVECWFSVVHVGLGPWSWLDVSCVRMHETEGLQVNAY